MKRTPAFFPLGLLLAAALAQTSCQSPSAQAAGLSGEFTSGFAGDGEAAPADSAGNLYLDPKALSFQDLQLYPIRASNVFINSNQHFGNYKPLKDGIESGTVKVTERNADGGVVPNVRATDEPVLESENVQIAYGDAATVNTLQIENTSNDTVFLMAGELVKGGKQDRVIAQDMILPPKSGKVDLPVFCVEQGRWTYTEGASFDGHKKMAANCVREVAVTAKDQSQVWEKVSEVTKTNDAISSTSTYNQLDQSPEFVAKRKAYLAYFETIFDTSSNVVGVIAMSGDSVIGGDLFFMPKLFRDQYKNLIYSYVTDAISKPAKAKDQWNIAQGFFRKMNEEIHAAPKASPAEEGATLRHKGRVVHHSKF